MKSGWLYEKTSSGARRPDRTGHRWSANWFSGRSEESRRTDRQSGRSGIWPRYRDGLGAWADRIGARKFKLRHYQIFGQARIVTRNGVALTCVFMPSRFGVSRRRDREK